MFWCDSQVCVSMPAAQNTRTSNSADASGEGCAVTPAAAPALRGGASRQSQESAARPRQDRHARDVVRMDLLDLLAYLNGIKADPAAFPQRFLERSDLSR